MSIRQLFVILAAAGGWLAGGPAEASAKGIILITTGDQIRELGPIAPSARGTLPPQAKVGYKNDHFGLFWMDIWTWNGGYCVYMAEGYEPIDEATAQRLLGAPGVPITTPFFYRYPLMLLILASIAGLIGALTVFGMITEHFDAKAVAALRQQTVYQDAEKLLSDEAPAGLIVEGEPTPPAEDPTSTCSPVSAHPGYTAALAFLMESGVRRDEAEKNLRLIVNARRGAKRPG